MDHTYRLLPVLLLAVSVAHAQPGYEVSLVFDRPNDSANPAELTVYDGRLFFTANTSIGGCTIWSYDAAGEISLEVHIQPGCSNRRPAELTVYDGRLFFTAYTPAYGYELWAYDATTGGAELVADIHPGPGYSIPTHLAVYNGRLFFRADDGETGRELWAYDATTDTTVLELELVPGPGDGFPPPGGISSPQSIAVYDGRLFFKGDYWNDPLRSYDATTGEVSIIYTDIPEEVLIVYDDRLFFFNRSGDLLAYDATTDEVTLIAHFAGCPCSPEDTFAAVYDGRLFFRADDGVTGAGTELWFHDAATGETALAADVWPGWRDSFPQSLAVYGGRLYFSATDDRFLKDYNRELWVYDAATGEASQVADIYPGVKGSFPRFLTVYDGHLYFNARNDLSNYELWRLGPVSTLAAEPGAPRTFTLTAASPNPFTLTTALRLTLPQPDVVTINVNDTLGRRVAVLHDGPMAAGEQALRWEAVGLPAGVYVVRVRTSGGDGATQRVTLVR